MHTILDNMYVLLLKEFCKFTLILKKIAKFKYNNGIFYELKYVPKQSIYQDKTVVTFNMYL